MSKFKLKAVLALMLASVLVLTGCFGRQDDTTPKQLVLSASACQVEPGGTINLEVKALTASKKEVAVSNLQWSLSDDSLGTLTPSGNKAVFEASAEKTGSTVVTVKSGQLSAKMILQVREGADPTAPCQDAGGLPIVETFEVADIEEFFSAEYKSLPTDPSKPLYVATAGQERMFINEDGHFVLHNGRFTVGMPEGRPDTSVSDTSAGGTLDLSRPWRITFEIVSAEVDPEGTDNHFYVYVDNNTTQQANSHLGDTSRWYRESVNNIGSGPLVIDGVVATKESFLQIRAASGAKVVIKSFKIEYL